MITPAAAPTGSCGGGAVAAAPVVGCGEEGAPTVAAIDAHVLSTVYRNELRSPEVVADGGHASSTVDLPVPVARGDRVGARAAGTRLVFHGGWHIVRLRVYDAAGNVLGTSADSP
jgi:hypothetical protein